jgi:hypothetical protein
MGSGLLARERKDNDMGTTGYFRFYEPEKKAVDYVRDELIGDGTHYEVVDHVGAKWWAIRRKADGYVFGVHAITHTDREMVYVKLVDESMGPGELAPLRIINKLTEPPTNDWARGWRERSREAAAAKKALPKLKAGDLVKFAKPIEFTNGIKTDTLRFVEKFRFLAYDRRPVRLRKDWKQNYQWEIVDEVELARNGGSQ